VEARAKARERVAAEGGEGAALGISKFDHPRSQVFLQIHFATMIHDLRITVLVENTARGANVLGEHGLALWIEADGHRILFDTGQGMVLHHNAARLKIPFDTAETVVISHGHFDHTGGLKAVLDSNEQMAVCLHPAALAPKYARAKTPPHRNIGIPGLDEQTLRQEAPCLLWTRGPTELITGVHVTGEIPRRNDYEDVGGPFYRDEACSDPDPLIDDQALYVETPAGLVVVLGCAHAGVVNTLAYVVELTGRQRIYAVLGGMHLIRASVPRLEATLAALERYKVKRVGTAHCTGTRAVTYLWSRSSAECFECSVGCVFAVRNGIGKVH
jgi:7,8-dihydropterin-6-yl-methyl-4-(beta-D-ribofuranosyl)aminobenzene 5'-phosphate synthase